MQDNLCFQHYQLHVVRDDTYPRTFSKIVTEYIGGHILTFSYVFKPKYSLVQWVILTLIHIFTAVKPWHLNTYVHGLYVPTYILYKAAFTLLQKNVIDSQNCLTVNANGQHTNHE